MTGISWTIVGNLELKNLGVYFEESMFPPLVAKPFWFVNLLLTTFDQYMYELNKEFYSLFALDYPATSLRLGVKFWYARCSDRFIVGVSGSYQDTVNIRNFIVEFLYKRLNFNLNIDKTEIIRLSDNYVEFLGYYISHSERAITPKLIIPKKVIKLWLINNGLANQSGKPKYVGKWIYLSDAEILDRFNSFIKDLFQYYKLGENKRDLHESIYIIKYAFFHTIAAKHRRRLSQVIKKYTFDKIKLKLVARCS